NTNATQSLGRVKILAARLEQARNQGASPNQGGENLSQLVYTSLQANGISISQFQPGTAGEARVRLDKVAYEPLMQWLDDRESRHQVVMRERSLVTNNDRGLVSVSVRLFKS